MNKWTLVIADLLLQDAGSYKCVVSNINGELTWNYQLDVLRK